MPIHISRPTTSGTIKEADVDVSEIYGLRWDNCSGNGRYKHSGVSLYGYISYELATRLGISFGEHTQFNNGVKVNIHKSHNNKPPYMEDYKSLLAQVGEKPKIQYNQSTNGEPLTKRILRELSDGAKTRSELRMILLAENYSSNQIMSALNRMKHQGRIQYDNTGNPQKQIIRISKPQT